MNSGKARDPAIDEYLGEGREILERVSKTLQLIERGANSVEHMGELYRDMHTLKGSSQLFGYMAVGQVAHAMETSLDPLRKSRSTISPRLIDTCLINVDLLAKLLGAIESSGTDNGFQTEVNHAVAQLVEAATAQFKNSVELSKDIFYRDEERSHKSAAVEKAPPKVKTAEKIKAPEELQSRVQSERSPVEKEQSSSNAASKVSDVAGGATPNAVSPQDSTIRVHVNLLDRILNLVGELVLVRNQLLQHRTKNEDTDFLNTSKSLDVVTSDLQSEVMKTRMQPIESVVGKFQRVVRDIARDLNKKIDLTLEGSDTELDKSLLESIKDPLTHIVRNSCDHGIETIEERKKAGKPDSGHVLIRAFHEGGQVVIEISDDGRGLHRERIVAKALERGIIDKERASKMSDREICELIFAPGFSTAAQVTSVSGRGVGMDVVKTNIDKVGGSVEISSVQGKGTTIQLRIPLTLAIVPALVIRSSKSVFAIPQVKLVELVRVGDGSASGNIEYLQGRPMFRLRGSLLPLLDIRDITGEKYEAKYDEQIYIVVLNSDGDHFGLLVPEILDTADIVVKPLSSFLKQLSAFSGATILGDGSIALILDVGGVAQFGKVLNKRVQKDNREAFSKQERKSASSDVQEFLLLSMGSDAVHAVPLCLVQRLEEFDVADIEQSGEQRVVRYRDALLPLIRLKTVLKYPDLKLAAASTDAPRTSIVVIQRSGRSYGLEVDEILDIVTIDGQIDDSIRDRAGILGNIIHQKEVVVVLDALGIIERFHGALSQGGRSEIKALGKSNADPLSELRSRNNELKNKKIRVLYAEDVAFFRRHVSKVLNEAGIDVTTFEDGALALQELDSVPKDQYNLILSDIEMPNMTGLELVREIRKREHLKNIPVIALTTRYRESDIEIGRQAGFDIYLEKLNPEKLMDAVSKLMGPTTREQEAKT